MDTNTLRELSRAASPAPWEVGGPYPGTSIIRMTGPGVGWPEPEPPEYDAVAVIDGRTEGEPNTVARADAALIVALRNDAEKYADLREAGMALAARLHEMYLGAETREKLAVFVAALAALGGEE